jgi:hypothetical protein
MLVKSDKYNTFRFDIPAAARRPGLSALVTRAVDRSRGVHIAAASGSGPWRPRRDIRLV